MKNKSILLIIIIFLVFCFVVFYKGLNDSNIYSPNIKDKKTIPFFKAKDFNSNTYLNSTKIFSEDIFYVVNIWASWCLPCRKEHPLLVELSKIKSMKLVGINYKDKMKKAKDFINEFGNPYSQIISDVDGSLSVEFGAYGVPETFLIDNNSLNSPDLVEGRNFAPFLLKLIKTSKRFKTYIRPDGRTEMRFGSGTSTSSDEEIIPNPNSVGSIYL